MARYLLCLRKSTTNLVEIIEKGKKLTQGIDILAENRRFQASEMPELLRLMPPREESTVMTVVCHPADFSASALARAVEDSNAHLLNMNVTGTVREDGRMTIELRTSLRHADNTIRSLARYGFETVSSKSFPEIAAADSDFNENMRSRAAELLHILNL